MIDRINTRSIPMIHWHQIGYQNKCRTRRKRTSIFSRGESVAHRNKPLSDWSSSLDYPNHRTLKPKPFPPLSFWLSSPHTSFQGLDYSYFSRKPIDHNLNIYHFHPWNWFSLISAFWLCWFSPFTLRLPSRAPRFCSLCYRQPIPSMLLAATINH